LNTPDRARLLALAASERTWVSDLHERLALSEKAIAVGKSISAYGYPSTATPDEMRAERITVDGKTFEMR